MCGSYYRYNCFYQDSVTAWILSCRRLYDLSRRKYSSHSFGIIASSIGGALADLISGYPHWAIPTAIIKAVNAVPFVLCRMAMKKRGKDEKIISPSSLLMLIPTTIVTIGGYFIANGLMYDFGAAIAELPTCWLQPGVGALIYIVVGIGLDKINFKKKLSL